MQAYRHRHPSKKAALSYQIYIIHEECGAGKHKQSCHLRIPKAFTLISPSPHHSLLRWQAGRGQEERLCCCPAEDSRQAPAEDSCASRAAHPFWPEREEGGRVEGGREGGRVEGGRAGEGEIDRRESEESRAVLGKNN